MVLSKKNLSWEINRENVLETLHRAGGRLESRLLMGHFMAGAKSEDRCNKKSLTDLQNVLGNVAMKKYTVDNNPIWELKKEFRV